MNNDIKPLNTIVDSTMECGSDGVFIGKNVYNEFYNGGEAIGEYINMYRLPMFNGEILRLKIQGIQTDNITLISIENLIKLGCDIGYDVVMVVPDDKEN